MDIERELKEKLLKLYEETDKYSVKRPFQRVVKEVLSDMDIEREKLEKLLKLFEETDKQLEEHEAYMQELRQRLSLAENVCFEANDYLRNKDNPLGRVYLARLEDAVKKWDSYRENKGSQYVVTDEELRE